MADKTRRTSRVRAARAHAKATTLKGKVPLDVDVAASRERLSRITRANRHDETDWGAPKKREVW